MLEISGWNFCHRMGHVILTLGRDMPLLRGARPLKLPALPEDAYCPIDPAISSDCVRIVASRKQ